MPYCSYGIHRCFLAFVRRCFFLFQNSPLTSGVIASCQPYGAYHSMSSWHVVNIFRVSLAPDLVASLKHTVGCHAPSLLGVVDLARFALASEAVGIIKFICSSRHHHHDDWLKENDQVADFSDASAGLDYVIVCSVLTLQRECNWSNPFDDRINSAHT